MEKKDLIRRLAPVVRQETWSNMEDYLESELNDARENLEASKDIRQINMLQGKIALYKKLINLPEEIRELI